MVTRARGTSKGEQYSVPDSPMTPPPSGGMDHSFSLQIMMELQRSFGAMSADVQSLKSEIEKSNAKLDKIEDRVSGVTHKIYAAGVVLVILVGSGGWMLNKVWDLAASHLADIAKASILQVQQQNNQPAASAATPPSK